MDANKCKESPTHSGLITGIVGGLGIVLIVNGVLATVVPHSFVTETEMACAPMVEKETLPGVSTVEVAGVPPAKVHANVIALLPQLVAKTVGMVEEGLEQALAGDVLTTTVGLSFTVTICWLVNVPHLLVTASVTVYVPGLVNEKEGLMEEALVPFVKLKADADPQLEAV